MTPMTTPADPDALDAAEPLVEVLANRAYDDSAYRVRAKAT